jgi:hypothetical protein
MAINQGANKMNIADLETASTEDMLDFYNANSKRKLKAFADRPTAIHKMTALINKLEAAAAEKPEPTAEELAAKAEQIKAKRAAGTSLSWAHPETRAKRIARHGVEVDGVYYKSVADAYRALGLPMNKHIAHRAELKANGRDEEYGMVWVAVPLRKAEKAPKKPKKVKEPTEAVETEDNDQLVAAE